MKRKIYKKLIKLHLVIVNQIYNILSKLMMISLLTVTYYLKMINNKLMLLNDIKF